MKQTKIVANFVCGGLVTCLLTGCLAVKSYVDPQFRSATYLSLAPVEQPKPIIVQATFQTNGKENKQLKNVVQSRVSKVLRGSKLFYEADGDQKAHASQLKLVVNNVGNIGDAVGKGVGTGLTFGLAGSKVVDGYEMTAVYTPPDAAPLTKVYKHAIHSTVGLHSAPEGLEPVPMQVAFDQVLEDMLLNFLRDLQKENAL